MYNETIFFQPINVNLLCVWILVHNPYARSAPLDVLLLPEFVRAVEFSLLS